jgi:protocatechuate 4,5-dioxygenase, beta chain
MATIIGCVMTSHVPAIGRAIAKGLQEDPYWKPFFDGFRPVHRWLARARPDVVVVFYNDHGLNFFLDALPTFAIGAAPEYRSADEGWNIPTVLPFAGDPELSWHVINSVVAAGFDVTTCQEMVVDHAVCNPMALLWPGGKPWPVTIVPVEVNTVQFPLPSAARCYELGTAVGEAVTSYGRDRRVLIMGTGGLSHQLDGERAGFINKEFDREFMRSLTTDPRWATQFSTVELVAKAGSQGVELMLWLAARAALSAARTEFPAGDARAVAATYHIPISNTAAGMMLLEPAAAPGPADATGPATGLATELAP